jgi:hypothetical protein
MIQRREYVSGAWTGWATAYYGSETQVLWDPAGPNRFQYRARACNGLGCSDWTPVASVGRAP